MLLLTLLPWLVFLLIVAPLLYRRGARLVAYPPAGNDAPPVSVIVPARNEAETVGACLALLLDSTYPRLEVILVDDQSDDGTAEVARALAERSGGELRVVAGAPVPEGWLGKPWACWQGYLAAHGELLLFTDADTRHDAGLLARAVTALETERADLVSVLPRQLMRTFWERVIMPQVMVVLWLRYRNLGRIVRARRPRDVVANGQYMLFRREAYEAVGGHEAVRGEVVEDLALAQRLAASGRTVFLAGAEELMEARMYRNLAEIVEGWSKNLATGARATVDPWLRPLLPWLLAALLLALWVAPPATFLAALFGFGSHLFSWAAAATSLSIAFWLAALKRFHAPVGYAVAYPIGALLAAGLYARSAARGRRITWKGRAYTTAGTARTY
jgi:chlorobactene glucosyltransferase